MSSTNPDSKPANLTTTAKSYHSLDTTGLVLDCVFYAIFAENSTSGFPVETSPKAQKQASLPS
jgi:hypothetical protein